MPSHVSTEGTHTVKICKSNTCASHEGVLIRDQISLMHTYVTSHLIPNTAVYLYIFV